MYLLLFVFCSKFCQLFIPKFVYILNSCYYQNIYNWNYSIFSSESGANKEQEKPQFPFQLKTVHKDGVTCAMCPWYTFCRGCLIPSDDTLIETTVMYCGIDWEPGVLHLRYQYSEEKVHFISSSILI